MYPNFHVFATHQYYSKKGDQLGVTFLRITCNLDHFENKYANIFWRIPCVKYMWWLTVTNQWLRLHVLRSCQLLLTTWNQHLSIISGSCQVIALRKTSLLFIVSLPLLNVYFTATVVITLCMFFFIYIQYWHLFFVTNISVSYEGYMI